MEINITSVASERKHGTFDNRVISWKFKLTTGVRCSGVLSSKNYPSAEKAMDAGIRMAKKLHI